MKILHVQVLPKMSGAQQISLDILSNFNTEENELFLICGESTNENSVFFEKFKEIGVKIIQVKTLRREIGVHDFFCFIELYNIFKKYNFDIIHTNSTKPGILARIAARLTGCKKIIHTVHGIAFHKHVSFPLRVLFYLAEYFSAFFGHVQVSVNKYYLKYYPLINTKLIYNGIDFNQFKDDKIKKDVINFAFLGRLDDQKNPECFIEAIHLLNKEIIIPSNVKFILAGDGDLKDKCFKLIYEYNLENLIDMVGWIENKNDFYNKVDVLCQPSKWEAFGLVFVEAGFFGIPSIAANVEGIPEVVIHNETGLIFDGTPNSLKDCLIKMINDKDLIHYLGGKAKERALNNFSKNKMLEDYVQIYKYRA